MMRKGLTIGVMLLLLGCFCPGALLVPQAWAAAPITRRIYAGREYVSLKDVARVHGLRCRVAGSEFELYSSANRMQFTAQKRAGKYNGVILWFHFAPTLIGGAPYVSAMDYRATLQPLLSSRSLKHGRITTILLDAGHGGTDQGAAGNGFIEKRLTLQITLRVKKKLEAMGFRVLLTRSRDRTLTLDQRTAFARVQKPDLFVSIHINAAKASQVKGIETFALTPPGAPSTGDSKVSYARYAGDRSADNSLALAMAVQTALRKSTAAEDRGCKRARFKVLRDATMPAILVECGFISNRGEAVQMSSGSHQEKIASGIANGIAEYRQRVR